MSKSFSNQSISAHTSKINAAARRFACPVGRFFFSSFVLFLLKRTTFFSVVSCALRPGGFSGNVFDEWVVIQLQASVECGRGSPDASALPFSCVYVKEASFRASPPAQQHLVTNGDIAEL